MKNKRAFYKQIWFWVVCTICFFALLGNRLNNNKEAKPVQADIKNFNISDEIQVHFIDVGQADAIFIDAGDNDILIDAGNRADGDMVVNYLKSLHTDDLEMIIATHPHEDHIGGMVDVINNFDVDLILKPGISSLETKTSKDFELIIDEKNIDTEIPSFEQQYIFGDVVITILSTQDNQYTETNDFSIVCRVDYGDTSFLMTGDAESPVEHDLTDSQTNLKVDVLKVGHHGGATSTTALFLHKVNPTYAVISVGEDNKYGHPDNLVTRRLDTNDIQTLRTDLYGNIIFNSDGKNVEFVTENKNIIINEQEKKTNKNNVEIVQLDKKAECVTITNHEQEAIDLTGWYILSNKGEQLFYFPDHYILEANQTIKIVGYGAKDTGDFNWEEGSGIWNNQADDDAKLFDGNSVLVSFFDDGM
jgi:beta-lactamase superfamily II metal-dependent hydrolase